MILHHLLITYPFQRLRPNAHHICLKNSIIFCKLTCNASCQKIDLASAIDKMSFPAQIVAPRQNAGGLPQRMRDGACASVTHQPRGERHAQAAAGQPTLPLFDPKMAAECATLCGRDTKERWARAEDGLQLPLAALERP